MWIWEVLLSVGGYRFWIYKRNLSATIQSSTREYLHRLYIYTRANEKRSASTHLYTRLVIEKLFQCNANVQWDRPSSFSFWWAVIKWIGIECCVYGQYARPAHSDTTTERIHGFIACGAKDDDFFCFISKEVNKIFSYRRFSVFTTQWYREYYAAKRHWLRIGPTV